MRRLCYYIEDYYPKSVQSLVHSIRLFIQSDVLIRIRIASQTYPRRISSIVCCNGESSDKWQVGLLEISDISQDETCITVSIGVIDNLHLIFANECALHF